jgi:hypothetical protein
MACKKQPIFLKRTAAAYAINGKYLWWCAKLTQSTKPDKAQKMQPEAHATLL